MMLSRTGWDRASLSIAVRSVGAGGHHGVVWQVRPPPPPPLGHGARQALQPLFRAAHCHLYQQTERRLGLLCGS